MKTLITGGAGFIGSNIVKAKERDGREFIVLDNLLSGHEANISELTAERLIRGDVREPSQFEHRLDGVTSVLHLAASVGNKRSIDRPFEDLDINARGTLELLEVCRRRGIRKIVVSSSAGIFGELKSLPIDELHPIAPDSPYGCSKLFEEKICLAYANLYDIECVALRYFNVYGPHQRFDAYGNVIPIFVFNLLRGEPITVYGDGEQTRDFVNVADIVRANLLAERTAGAGGVFNIGSGSRVTINHLIELLGHISGQRIRVNYRDPRPGDVKDSLANITRARDVLGFEPSVDLESGLREYWAWARTEHERT